MDIFSGIARSGGLAPLQADVYVAPAIPIPPSPRNAINFWQPISSTLIYGAKEAILVDTPVSINQTNDLADWIEETLNGKKLTKIFITHGHGDHFFGLPILQQRFPGVQAIASKGTVAHMKEQLDIFDSFWVPLFPNGQIPLPVVIADPLPPSDSFTLEGHLMQAVEVGQSDTFSSTVLHVPDLALAVCGDVVYGDNHQFLFESNTTALRHKWISAIEKVEALKPQTVVAGHKRPFQLDGAYNLAASKKYIATFDNLVAHSKNADELYNGMLKAYPDRINHFILEISVSGITTFPS
jgi:glyoxylase-like metal-dependent hydrolase (beta-lactamase superfamily II)